MDKVKEYSKKFINKIKDDEKTKILVTVSSSFMLGFVINEIKNKKVIAELQNVLGVLSEALFANELK